MKVALYFQDESESDATTSNAKQIPPKVQNESKKVEKEKQTMIKVQ